MKNMDPKFAKKVSSLDNALNPKKMILKLTA